MMWLCVFFGIAAAIVVADRAMDALVRIKEAKYASLSSGHYVEHDLETYTYWLAEKGALVAGFRIDSLVEDYACESDSDRG